MVAVKWTALRWEQFDWLRKSEGCMNLVLISPIISREKTRWVKYRQVWEKAGLKNVDSLLPVRNCGVCNVHSWQKVLKNPELENPKSAIRNHLLPSAPHSISPIFLHALLSPSPLLYALYLPQSEFRNPHSTIPHPTFLPLPPPVDSLFALPQSDSAWQDFLPPYL